MAGRHRKRDPGRFTQEVADTAAVNLLTVVITVVSGLLIARLLGSSGRGTYAAVVAYVLATAAICELGLTASICFHVARRRVPPAAVVRTGALAILVCGSVAGAGGYLLAPLILQDHANGELALRIAFAAEPVLFLGGAWASAVQAADIRSWNFVRLSQPVFYVLAVTGLAATGQLDVVGVTFAFVFSSSAQAVLAWQVSRRKIGRGGTFQPRLLRPMLRYGLANTTSRVPYLVNTRIDQLLLAVMVTPAALGNYAVAVTLSLSAAPLSTAFGAVALPRIAARGAAGNVDDSNGKGIVTKAVVGSLAIGLPAVLLVCAAAPWVVPRLLGPSYGDVVGLLWLMAPGSVVYGSNKVIGDVLRGLDRSITVAWAEAAAVVVTVVLLVVLLPVVGVAGAAIASTGAYVVAFGFLVRALFKHSGMTVGLAAGRLRRSRPTMLDALPEGARSDQAA